MLASCKKTLLNLALVNLWAAFSKATVEMSKTDSPTTTACDEDKILRVYSILFLAYRFGLTLYGASLDNRGRIFLLTLYGTHR